MKGRGNMNNLKWMYVLGMLFLTNAIWAQKYWNENEIKHYALQINESSMNDETYDELMSRINNTIAEPLNLNNVSLSELLTIPLLTQKQALLILKHKNQYGLFLHIAELGSVEGLSFEDAKWIAQFVFVNKSNNSTVPIKPVLLSNTHIFKNIENSSFLGDAWQHRIKALLQIHPSIQLGFQLEKDAGEPWLAIQKTGFDYSSFHLSIERKALLNKVIIGDFEMHSGQGLSLGMGYQIRMSADPIQTVQLNTILNKHLSFNELNLMRGLAFQIAKKNWSLYPFVSVRKLDAKLVDDTNSFSQIIVSEQNSGYHRTLSEISNQGQLNQKYIGFYFQQKSTKFTWGLSYFNLQQQAIKNEQKNNPMYWVERNVNKYSNYGLDCVFLLDQSVLSFAFSIDNNSDFASYVGYMKSFGQQLDWGLSMRWYSPFYSNPLAAGPLAFPSKNQKGIFQSFNYTPSKKWTFKAYLDVFENLWIGSNLPIRGEQAKIALQSIYQLSALKKLGLFYRYLVQNENLHNEIKAQAMHQIGFNSQTELHANWRLETKFQTYFTPSPEPAMCRVFSQTLHYQDKKIQIQFQMNTYENLYSKQLPISVHEADLSGQSGLMVLNGSGNSCSLLVKFKLNNHFKIACKLGSNKQQLQPNFTNTFKIQLQLQ